MSPNTENLLQTALSLPVGEQVELIEALIAAQEETDPQPLDEAWMAEIQRRSAEFDAGKATPIPWAVVRERRAGETARMPDVSFLPAAEADYQAALAWYRARSPQAAARFDAAVADAMQRVGDRPELYALVDNRHRRCLLRRYPYSLIYRVEFIGVVVVAVAHARRSSSYWQGRA